MSFIIVFIVILVLQYALSYLFSMMGLNYYISDTLINLVLAFIFSIWNYRGLNKETLKNPYFHRSVAIYFVIFMLFSLLYWFVF